MISERKTVVGGQAAIEYRYRGVADGHDWSGTLAVVAHGGEIFTVLGMTFADTDLIQNSGKRDCAGYRKPRLQRQVIHSREGTTSQAAENARRCHSESHSVF